MNIPLTAKNESAGANPVIPTSNLNNLLTRVSLRRILGIIIFIFFSTVSLIGQTQNFDPDGLIPEKLEEINNLEADELLELTEEEIDYISTNVEGIKATIVEVKKSIKKLTALGKETELLSKETYLEQLRSLRKSYTLIMHKTSSNI